MKRPDMRRAGCLRALTTLCVATTLLSGCAGESESTPGATTRALPVQAYAVEPRDLSRTIQVSAPVQSLRAVRLAAQISGVVTEVHVEAGDEVQQHQLVAELDVRETRAELARAVADLAEQQANFERLAALLADGFVDRASYSVAEARVQSARANADLWQTRVDFGQVTSTLNGVVIERLVEPGEAVSQYAPLLVLADTDNLVVRFGLSELDVAGVLPGMPVAIEFDALRDAVPMQGSVRRIMPTTEGPSRLVTVEVALPQVATETVRIGYLARAAIAVDRQQDVLAVPLAAVATDADGSYVMVIADDRLQRREIQTGQVRGEWRQVLAGLKPGELIVTSNPADLIEGETVRIVSRLGGDRP